MKNIGLINNYHIKRVDILTLLLLLLFSFIKFIKFFCKLNSKIYQIDFQR